MALGVQEFVQPGQPEVMVLAAPVYDGTQICAFLYAATHITGSCRVTDASTIANFGTAASRATVTLYLTDRAGL